MTKKQILFSLLVAAAGLLAIVYYWPVTDETANKPKQQTAPLQQERMTPVQSDSSVIVDETGLDQADPLDGVVRQQFADKPHIQKAWVSRGQGVVLNNYPGADSADFRNSFFYRGFKDRAVTCGEVRFQVNGEVTDDYQRFIYVGGQLSHLENDVQNFYLLWDKLCVQTYNQ